MARKYLLRTYGCQMNEHDSERIAGLLEADGFEAASGLDDADVVVLNTCCIRENADNKLYGNLGHLKTVKQARPDLQIVVAGVALGLFYTAIAMGVSSLTTRRSAAAVAIVLLAIVPNLAITILVQEADAPDELALLQPAIGEELAWRIFGDTHGAAEILQEPITRLSTPLVVAPARASSSAMKPAEHPTSTARSPPRSTTPRACRTTATIFAAFFRRACSSSILSMSSE